MIDLIDGDTTTWEKEPLENLAQMGELMGYQHNGFWQPMDTLRDKRELESFVAKGETPWLEFGTEKSNHDKK